MGGQLVRVAAAGLLGQTEGDPNSANGRVYTDPLKPVAGEVHPDWLTTALSEGIRWKKLDRRTGFPVVKNPPDWVARALVVHKDWPNIRALAGITSAPILREDGSVRTDPGYDAITGMLLVSDDDFLSIPPQPSKSDAEDAAEVLENVFQHYQFSDKSGLSTALSLILTRVARHLMPLAPFHLITAPTAGSGKTYIPEVAAIICDGANASLRAWTDDDAELRKSLTACAVASQGVVCFDNIPNGHVVSSPVLDQFLTARIWEDRILGIQRNVHVRNTLVLAGTGNNVRFAQDSIRRVIVARVLVETESPWKRKFDWTPAEYARKHRRELLQAACTILSAFLKAGRPAPEDGADLGTFEEWSRIVRNALLWLGFSDPCASQEAFMTADASINNLAALLDALRASFGSKSFTTSEALAAARYDHFGEVVLTDLGGAMAEMFRDKRGALPTPQRLGGYFETHRDRIAGGAMICISGYDRHKKTNIWQVRAVGP
jgi:putative DNA primase/helicase